MSTIQTINGIKHFQCAGELIVKVKGKWVNDKGQPFDRNKLHNVIHSKSGIQAQERCHIRSIMNRLYKTNYKFN